MSNSNLDANHNEKSPAFKLRQNVENDLDKVKAHMAKLPKDYDAIVAWKMDTENWLVKMDGWLNDFQVMSSAYIKPKLMSMFKKLNELFEKVENQERELLEKDDSLYHHNLVRRDSALTNEEYERMIRKFNDFEPSSEK